MKTLTEPQDSLEFEEDNTDNGIEDNLKQIKYEFNFPLNTILYGPPGTGKTYNSIFYSVGIIEKNGIIFKIKNFLSVFNIIFILRYSFYISIFTIPILFSIQFSIFVIYFSIFFTIH